MIKNLKYRFQKNLEISVLIVLILVTTISTSYFNYKKNIDQETYNNFIDNIYFKKTLNHIVENLDQNTKKLNKNGRI